MVNSPITVLILAAGTGGHIFPAMSVARELQMLGAKVEWLGTLQGSSMSCSRIPRYPFIQSGSGSAR